MARRPEKPTRRGRRSESTLDWLAQPEVAQPDQPARSVAEQPAAAAQPPQAQQPTQTEQPTQALRHLAPDTGAVTLSRRAARAQREAEQAGQPPPAAPEPAAFEPGKPDEPAPGRTRFRVAAWLTVAALALALWSGTAFLDSGDFLLDGLASVVPLVSVFALPVIAIGVAGKHLVPTVIAVAAALLPWTLVAGYVIAGPGSTAVGTNSTLRVMSVDGGQGQASAQDIVQTARTYSANIVVVTQLSNELAHQLTVDGLNLLGSAQWVQIPANGMNGVGLWSGPQIGNLQQITELSQPGVDGVIDAGTANARTAKVGITVVQLSGEPFRPSSSWHRDLTRLAARTTPTKPGFIVGDLNATPWQPGFRKLAGPGWRDAADVIGQGLRPTWPTWSPLPIAPLDHVLVSPGLGVSSADTVSIAGSGHRALIVTLVLPNG